mmetsp:Transcript_41117/g.86225  ORF Transcript_41117/g.86225 Transcript_41117/m.86225 type:complete len:121 (+) Transcript_41117:110-472(+)
MNIIFLVRSINMVNGGPLQPHRYVSYSTPSSYGSYPLRCAIFICHNAIQTETLAETGCKKIILLPPLAKNHPIIPSGNSKGNANSIFLCFAICNDASEMIVRHFPSENIRFFIPTIHTIP